jgi:hypothetical protein
VLRTAFSTENAKHDTPVTQLVSATNEFACECLVEVRSQLQIADAILVEPAALSYDDGKVQVKHTKLMAGAPRRKSTRKMAEPDRAIPKSCGSR